MWDQLWVRLVDTNAAIGISVALFVVFVALEQELLALFAAVVGGVVVYFDVPVSWALILAVIVVAIGIMNLEEKYDFSVRQNAHKAKRSKDQSGQKR